MFGFGKTTEKKERPTLVLLTGNSLRHYYFANRLAENYNVVGVVSEATKPHDLAEAADQHPLVRLLYSTTLEKEQLYFGNNRDFTIDKQNVLILPYGQINMNIARAFMSKRAPDYVVVFDASPLAEPLIETYRGKILHLHNGLLNYYNGSYPNLWPIIENRLECVGMSVHSVENSADDGPVLGQVRPVLAATDEIADIDLKSVVAGVTLMNDCIGAYYSGRRVPQAQARSEISHTIKDLMPDKILKMKEAMKAGLVQAFLEHQTKLRKTAPIKE